MARVTRIALDLALVSLQTVRPAISKVWSAAKNMVTKSPAKPLVDNPVVSNIETALDKVTNVLVAKITLLRDYQLPAEQQYLERELEKVKRKLGGHGQASGKSLRPALGTAWQYAKVECVPPTTLSFFNGPAGKKLEDTVAAAADNVIAGIENKIREIDAEEERVKREKEAEIRAAVEKAKAEEAKKRKEAEMKALEEKKAKDKEAATKKAEEDKKTETKAVKKPEKPKKELPKTVPKK